MGWKFIKGNYVLVYKYVVCLCNLYKLIELIFLISKFVCMMLGYCFFDIDNWMFVLKNYNKKIDWSFS